MILQPTRIHGTHWDVFNFLIPISNVYHCCSSEIVPSTLKLSFFRILEAVLILVLFGTLAFENILSLKTWLLSGGQHEHEFFVFILFFFRLKKVYSHKTYFHFLILPSQKCFYLHLGYSNHYQFTSIPFLTEITSHICWDVL